MAVTTNLRILESSRRAPKEGDIFALRPRDDVYLFGRVVSTKAKAGEAMPNAILIYIYRHQEVRITPPNNRELAPDRLLIPPLMTNRLPWSRGYFQTVDHWQATPADVLARHCFFDFLRGVCFDEFAVRLARCIEPCGQLGLHSFRTIDDAVSEALGIPLAPD
jgi:hypothetical protein